MASETTPPGQPEPLVIPTGEPWTPEQITWFRERLKAAMANPGPLRVLPSDHWKDRAEAAEAKLAEYENAIGWNTSCTSCARVLDSAYAETCRRERAEANLSEIAAMARVAMAYALPDAEPVVAAGRILAVTGSEDEVRDA